MHFFLTGAALLLGVLRTVDAHGQVTALFINDEPLGRGVCLRNGNGQGRRSFPLEDLTSSDLTCGIVVLIGYGRIPCKC